MIGIMLSVLIIGQFNISSEAAGVSSSYTFDVSYPEPYSSDTSGYFCVMYSGGGYNNLHTYFWTLTPLGGTNASSEFSSSVMNVTVTYEGVTFTPSVQGALNYSLTIGRYNGNDDYEALYNGITNSWSFHNAHGSSYPIKGYLKGGNAQLTPQTTLNNVSVPRLHWSESVDSYTLYSYMQNILNRCANIDDDTSTIISQLTYIYNQNAETNIKMEQMKTLLNNVIDEQKKSNTWLEKIYNFLTEKDEKDKEVATQQGTSSTSQGMEAIENKGDGFKSSLGGLVSKMNYSGTDCSWQFPEVRLPQIDGVMDSKVLIRSQVIDFGQWINAIPSGILLLVQSLLTVALIVYCFKEFYGTIEYVLTMRKGGVGDE